MFPGLPCESYLRVCSRSCDCRLHNPLLLSRSHAQTKAKVIVVFAGVFVVLLYTFGGTTGGFI